MNDTEFEQSTNRKRKRNEELYQRNKIKKARVKGESYTNYKNVLVPARRLGACGCKKKCTEKILDVEKEEIFQKFYEISSKNEQDMFLQGLILCKEIKRRRPRTEGAKKRGNSFSYYILLGSGRKEVCHNAFLGLYGISSERVKRIRRLLQAGCTPVDKRGKQKSRNAMKPSAIISVSEHISMFPTKQTHYGTREFNYLDAGLNVKIMYSLFMEKNPTSKIKYEYYNKIFRENFNLSFGRPQVDVCNECETISLKLKNKSLNETSKRVAEAELMVHKRRAKKFYNSLKASKEACRNQDNVLAISFDYMQNLQLPRCPAQDLFYLSQLTVSVFGVHNMKTDDAVFFLYHEGQARKSPNEVCSFLLKYINSYVGEHITELHLFCDNCPGQNKNHAFLRFCSALVSSGRFAKVEIFFPIRGHSFLPCDRDFGVIKRKLRKIDRVYTPMDYVEMIVTSSAKHRFTVHLVDSSQIKDFRNWWVKYFKKDVISVETSARSVPRNAKERFNISKFHYFLFKQENGKGVIVARNYIGGLTEHTFPLLLPGLVTIDFPKDSAIPNGKVPISDKKMAHIKKAYEFVDGNEEIQSFWREILEWPTISKDAQVF